MLQKKKKKTNKDYRSEGTRTERLKQHSTLLITFFKRLVS